MPRVQTSGFASIPNALLDLLGHNKNIGWLYLWLFRHGNGSETGAWASISTLATECCMKPAAVKAGLRWLVEQGWVVRRSRPGRSSRYLLRMNQTAERPPGRAQPQETTQPRKGACLANEPQDLGSERDLGTKRAPGTEWTPPPGYQTGPNTWGPNGPHKQEPRNKNPGTSNTSSLQSLSPMSPAPIAQGQPEHKGEKESGEGQPANPAATAGANPGPPLRQTQSAQGSALAPAGPRPAVECSDGPFAPEGGLEQWTSEERKQQLELEAAYTGPIGAAEDPAWRVVNASPDFPWGGPFARPAPPEPAAVAPRLPVAVERLPAGLRPIADRVEAYWLGKAGARNPAAFQALVEELVLVLARAGRPGVVELLRQALQAGWPALNGSLWLAQRHREPDLSAHPAYQVFRAS